MLVIENTMLLVIDVQGKLATLMHKADDLFTNIGRAADGASVLGLPVLLTEQIPDKLGTTIPEIAGHLPGVTPIAKSSFSCCGEDAFMDAVTGMQRRQILVAGIETHICVMHTCLDLIDMHYDVHLLVDCVSSRSPENRWVGIERIREAGAAVSSVETALFELMKVASGDAFRKIINIIR